MDVIAYVLSVPIALVGVYALLVFLSLRFCCRDDVSFPVDDSDDEEDETALEHHTEADVRLPLMAVDDGDEDEGERPAPDWRNRATVISGTGRRLRVVRRRNDLKEVPPLHDADKLGDRCPRGESGDREDVMPPNN